MTSRNLFMIVALVIFTSLAYAQQTSASDSPKNALPSQDASLPSIDNQLAVLTEKLDLSAEQQKKIRPILKNLHEATEKLMQDQSLSQEERLAKIRPQRYKANADMRAFLSESQKMKLDQYLAGPHPEMHGSLTGKPPAPQH